MSWLTETPMSQYVCEVAGCSKKAKARYLCGQHAQRQYIHGDPHVLKDTHGAYWWEILNVGKDGSVISKTLLPAKRRRGSGRWYPCRGNA